MLNIDNKTILITGGSGILGRKFIEITLRDYPGVKKIIVYSRDEMKHLEMMRLYPHKQFPQLRFFVGDVRDKERLMRACEGVDILIHAASLMTLEASEYNPDETIKTNITGAQNVIEAAIDKGVKKVVALSTDKACAPINLYGATKLCSDKLFITGNIYCGSGVTRFSVVRYGNVAGSRGSVIPFFQKLVKEGATELPITDMRMTRFWLKLEQAVEMVLKALETMQGGELFVKKIPSMKMPDLAKAIAPNLKIKEVGIRPGEKIHEQMITVADAPNTIELEDYYIILPQIDFENIQHNYPSAKRVAEDFEYHSGNNDRWLTVEDMRKLISEI